MRQASLWSAEREGARTELWDGMPQAVRSEVVERLVRIVVNWAMKTESKVQGGERGFESSTRPPRT